MSSVLKIMEIGVIVLLTCMIVTLVLQGALQSKQVAESGLEQINHTVGLAERDFIEAMVNAEEGITAASAFILLTRNSAYICNNCKTTRALII